VRKQVPSLRNQVKWMMLVLILPVVLFVFSYVSYTLNVIDERVASSHQSLLEMFNLDLEKDMSDVKGQLTNLLINDSSFEKLDENIGELQAHLCMQEAMKSFIGMLQSKVSLGAMFLFSAPNNLYRGYYAESYSKYAEKEKIREYLKQIVSKGDSAIPRGWFVGNADGYYHIFIIMGRNGAYYIAMLDIDSSYYKKYWGKDGEKILLLFVSSEGQIMNHNSFPEKDSIDLTGMTEKYKVISGGKNRYFAVRKKMNAVNISMVLLSPYKGFWTNMDVVQILLLFLSFLLIVAVLPIFYWLLRHYFFRPLKKFVNTMEIAGENNTEVRNQFNTKEFQLVNTTFNKMIHKIEALRIEAYEREIAVKKAQLQYLHIQIRPHFYLNCLKNLYALAQQQKYSQIQDTIIELSVYLRHMLRDESEYIILKDELKSVQSYLALQTINGNSPIYSIQVENQLLSEKIPPLTILTFVENAIKHGTRPEEQLEIKVVASMLDSESERYLNLRISNNGAPFSEEMLEKLNAPVNIMHIDEHVGISNIKLRLNLLYSGKAEISFYNKGALSCEDIFIPLYEKRKKDGELSSIKKREEESHDGPCG
jgi:two-component system sensor histidine kinase YesM